MSDEIPDFDFSEYKYPKVAKKYLLDVETRMKAKEAAFGLFNGTIQPPRLTLWQKIKLWFIRPEISVDVGHGGDKSVWVIFKQVDGITVVVDQGEGDDWVKHLPHDTQPSPPKKY